MNKEELTKYRNDYNKKNYDIIKMSFPKGYKNKITIQANNSGYKSISEYIRMLIDADINTGGVKE